MPPLFNKVIIIGVGQIGASIGMNLVAQRLALEVIGVGRDPKNLREAIRKKAVHRVVRNVGAQFIAPGNQFGSNDLIILATPVQTIRDLLKVMPKEPLIVDVGSTKRSILEVAERRGLRFIGCHPIAGTEKGGAKGADRNLFREKICLITPGKKIPRKDLGLVVSLWRKVGSRTMILKATEHDQILSTVSHLPHVLAFALANFARRSVSKDWLKRLWSGLGSFRSGTRVIGSPVSMVSDLLMENRENVRHAIDNVLRELKIIKSLLAPSRKRSLEKYLSQIQKHYQDIS